MNVGVGSDQLALGTPALLVLGVYLLLMLALVFLGRIRRQNDSLRDFYLAGEGFGFAVLFLTLFATQYSGNTLLGFAGRSYQQGLSYVVSVTFMIAVVGVLIVYAPRLYRLARRYQYITPTDFVFHRFGSHQLRLGAVVLLCWGLANYVLEQLVAMGHAVEAISGGRLSFMQGVLLLALVMLIYVSLGGVLSVPWTDTVQGGLLLAGCAVILFALVRMDGGLVAATERIAEVEAFKLERPDGAGLRLWMSQLVLLGIGVEIYPHAIQRVFSARRLGVLRASLAVMAFMPLLTTLLAFLLGYVGSSRFPGLDRLESDRITLLVLADLAQRSPWTYWLVILVLCAVVAAIMSTADSALLSIASMFTRDVYQPYLQPRLGLRTTGRHLLAVGKIVSWSLLAVLILLAWASLRTESSIWLLIRLKLEFMVQLAPCLLLGLYWRRLHGRAVFWGMVAGSGFTLAVWLGVMAGLWQSRSPFEVSAGVWALLLKALVAVTW